MEGWGGVPRSKPTRKGFFPANNRWQVTKHFQQQCWVTADDNYWHCVLAHSTGGGATVNHPWRGERLRARRWAEMQRVRAESAINLLRAASASEALIGSVSMSMAHCWYLQLLVTAWRLRFEPKWLPVGVVCFVLGCCWFLLLFLLLCLF